MGTTIMISALLLLVTCIRSPSHAFQPPNLGHCTITTRTTTTTSRPLSRLSALSSPTEKPQVFATGYSPKVELLEALQEATDNAIHSLPKPLEESKIDLAIITVSSLYDGQSSPSVIVPAVLSSGAVYGKGIQNLVGCTSGGIISSMTNFDMQSSNENDEDASSKKKKKKKNRACIPIESEGVPGVSVTLCILPEVNIKTFHVLGDDVPDEVGRISPDTWKNAVGLRGFGSENVEEPPAFMLIPSPAFQNDLDDLLQGLSYSFPKSLTFGAIASTVSSLSRARLFRFDASDPQCIQTLADGCVGVALEGDVEIKTMIAQGAKPVGGVYRIVTGVESTIKAIVLDEVATQELEEEEDSSVEQDEETDTKKYAKAAAAAAYAKAMMPKPILAEANFVMRTLSDDDQSFMRKALLVGLERGGTVGRTANELARLAEGKGHRFTVHQVASAGMKDGSVTLPLGSVDVQPGTRLRFFVREGDFARKEAEALWMGYKKKTLEETFAASTNDEQEAAKLFQPSGCLVLSTLDRGTKLFGGKPGYESDMASTFLPALPAVSGIFSNGILGRLDDTDSGGLDSMVHGSAAEYVLIGSKSRRPIYSPAKAAAEEAAAAKKQAEKDAAEKAMAAEDEKRSLRSQSPLELEQSAPRSPDGELILKRREVHSGRAMTVSTVEWSVAEKTATPTSVLEGFMWDKETEVDRLRERVPLSNLVSQCRLFSADPTKPKPRDWVGAVKLAAADGFVIVPECKRMEPVSGSLRKRYDLAKLIKQFTMAGAPAFSVNCDSVLYGGSLDDVTKAREASSSAAADLSAENDDGVVVPPILASDLLLYPYQLYKLRLAGADAVNLVAGALASKDLLYLTKIASSLQLQVMASVTSKAQIRALMNIEPGQVSALILSNRELEDFTFDMTGKQALDLLASDELKKFRAKHGDDLPVLVEGRVGLIERADETGAKTSAQYLKELDKAGALGAIVGGGLVATDEDAAQILEKLLATR